MRFSRLGQFRSVKFKSPFFYPGFQGGLWNSNFNFILDKKIERERKTSALDLYSCIVVNSVTCLFVYFLCCFRFIKLFESLDKHVNVLITLGHSRSDPIFHFHQIRFFFPQLLLGTPLEIQHKFIIQHKRKEKKKQTPKRVRCNRTNVPCETPPLLIRKTSGLRTSG